MKLKQYKTTTLETDLIISRDSQRDVVGPMMSAQTREYHFRIMFIFYIFNLVTNYVYGDMEVHVQMHKF